MIKFFDEDAIISPDKLELGSDVAVITFSDHLFDILEHDFGAKKVHELSGCAPGSVYEAEAFGKRVLFYQSTIGAPAAVGALEELYACGVKHAVVYGICGSLVHMPPRTLIVPNRAFRDEGTSYHYMPPSEDISVKNSGVVAARLKASGVSVLEGGVWTTDAFYRETRTRMEQLKARGAIAVDMECAALQAVSDYRKREFYTFFISADSLAGDEWNPNYINDGKHDREPVDVTAAHAAVRLAAELSGK